MSESRNSANLVLISPYAEIHSYGVRSLAAYLKAKGVTVKLIFVPLQSNVQEYVLHSRSVTIPSRILADITEIARDAHCIGISLMTDQFHQVQALTRELKLRLPHIPILWGGIHPTILPEQCVKFADYVCVGEGYESTFELLQYLSQGEEMPKLSGICYQYGDQFVTGPVREPMFEIDNLPFADYGIDGHYVRVKNSIQPMTPRLLNRVLGFWYTSFFTLGCPNNCSYCCNSVYHRLHPLYARVRKHSPEYINDEINSLLKQYSFIKMVKFNDDSFLSMTDQELARFRDLRNQHGRLPFVATGMIPNLLTESKLALLIEAGLLRGRIGIQTASERILREVYNRKNYNDEIVRCSTLFARYAKQLVPPAYDVILDNPWETSDDRLQTLQLLRRLHRPYLLNLYSLNFYPNTEIHRMALEQSLVGVDESLGYTKSYLAWDHTYLNCLIALAGLVRVTPSRRAFLIAANNHDVNPKVPKLLRNGLNASLLAKRVYYHIIRRDVTMIPYPVARFLR